jgi:phage baseplate assembly protein gpV
VLTVGGNLKATGAYANISTTEYITLKTPTVTIDSNNTIITGNLVVQGSRTYIDTTHQVSQDKTIVLGTGSDVFSNSTFTAADPTTIVSRRNNSNTAHSLTNGDMILVVSSSDTTNIPAEALYSVTTVNTIAFTIDIVGAPSGAGTLDWTGPQLDASIDDGGLIIAGNTVHKFTWDNADDAWHLTDSLVVAGDVTVTSNIIKNSDGEAAITMNADRETTFANSIQINGNVIRESGGVDTITMHANTNVTIAGDLQVSGNQIKASTGDDTQSFIGANVSFPGRITFASGAAANTILVGSSTGLLTHAAFGIYDSAGVRLGPG